MKRINPGKKVTTVRVLALVWLQNNYINMYRLESKGTFSPTMQPCDQTNDN